MKLHGSLTLIDTKPGEIVHLVLRRHWIMYFYLALYGLVLLSSTSALIMYGSGFAAFIGIQGFAIILTFYWMTFLLFLYMEWLNGELDVLVITSHRVIGLEQIAFLNRIISECSLGRVQEVNAQTKGILSNIFSFGLLTLETASTGSNFRMPLAPEALENARRILNVIDEYKSKLPKDEPVPEKARSGL